MQSPSLVRVANALLTIAFGVTPLSGSAQDTDNVVPLMRGALLAAVAAGAAAPAQGRPLGACETVAYTVSIQDTAYFRVQMRFQPEGQIERLFMAENSPGGLREVYARFVEAVRAEREGGGALSVRRVGASAWEVGTGRDQCVVVTYRVRRHLEDPLGLVSNALAPGSAYFMGATTLLGAEGHAHRPATLTVEPPTGWSVWTTLPSAGSTTFRASSYRELAWAPVLVGNARPLDVALGQDVVRIVAFDMPSDSLLGPIGTRFEEIAHCQRQIFGFLPEPLILVGLRWRPDLDYGGGVARHNAVVMNIGRAWMPEPGRFASATFAHELFHTWNWGLFYPAEIRPWQPLGRTATRALWLVEGLTDYYVLQTFVRLGRMDVQRSLDWIGGEMAAFEASPARAWASLEDGGPMDDAGAVNGVNVRAGGFVVGFILDALIRRETQDRANLDDVVRALAVAARQDSYAGYRADDVVRAVRAVGGDRVAAAYSRLVEEPGPVDYGELLRGTAYHAEIVADSTMDGGRRWQVIERAATGGVTPTLGVLHAGCDRDR